MIDSDTFWLGVWWGLSLFAVWELSGIYHYKKAIAQANKAVSEFIQKLKRLA